MDTQAFIKLAVSKDDTRPNLCEVYRDKAEIVATDGHRLHWSNGLPEVQPHFLSGLNAEYPDWRQVVLHSAPDAACQLWGRSLDYAKLKAFHTLVKAFDKKCQAVRAENSAAGLNLSAAKDGMKAEILLPSTEKEGTPFIFTVGFNLGYLLDALKPLDKSSTMATINFRDNLKPIQLDYTGEFEHCHAILMPMRLDQL